MMYNACCVVFVIQKKKKIYMMYVCKTVHFDRAKEINDDKRDGKDLNV